jgi:hypothetical protein
MKLLAVLLVLVQAGCAYETKPAKKARAHGEAQAEDTPSGERWSESHPDEKPAKKRPITSDDIQEW